jgi:hypothetical protein
VALLRLCATNSIGRVSLSLSLALSLSRARARAHARARALSLPFSLSKRTHTHTQVESCLFQFHSKADEYVPYSMGQKLWDAKGSDPRCSLWVSHDTALHDDAITKVEQLSLKEWLAKL